MANTFKVKTNASMPSSSGTPDDLYTVPSSTTSVVLGLIIANRGASQVTVDVKLVSDTSDSETNQTVFLINDAPIPAGSSLDLLSGNKVVVQTTDKIQIDCSSSAGVDAALSIMEIT